MSDIKKNQTEIFNVLKILDTNLADKNYIVGEFSLADIHWAAVLKVLEEEGNSVILDDYKNICSWLTKIKSEIPGYDTKVEKVAA